MKMLLSFALLFSVSAWSEEPEKYRASLDAEPEVSKEKASSGASVSAKEVDNRIPASHQEDEFNMKIHVNEVSR